MKIYDNYSLKKENTFGVDVSAKYFAEISAEEELMEILKKLVGVKLFVLGGGANVLFTKDYEGLVIKNLIKGVKIKEEDEEKVVLEVGAGESWHELVMFAVERGWGGIENMVYIPGTVGAAPVQNIAAYGQNFSDVFVNLDAVEVKTGIRHTFNKRACEFEYRGSRFKSKDLGRFVVTKVRIRLTKRPKINTSYFETGKTFAKNVSLISELSGISKPTVRDVAMAVMNIRKQKLPDVSEVGTAGSVFKNPVISRAKYEELKKGDPDLQAYPVEGLNYQKKVEGEFVKVPAGRLLDNLGWKGRRVGAVGTHPTQALAVVNYGGAKPEEIINFMNDMKADVMSKYGIELEEEVLFV